MNLNYICIHYKLIYSCLEKFKHKITHVDKFSTDEMIHTTG